MRTRIDARPASAEETADVLGVPRSRLKRLLALAKPWSIHAPANGNRKAQKSGAAKRHVRDKVAKNAR